jgi:hypothetical protein
MTADGLWRALDCMQLVANHLGSVEAAVERNRRGSRFVRDEAVLEPGSA